MWVPVPVFMGQAAWLESPFLRQWKGPGHYTSDETLGAAGVTMEAHLTETGGEHGEHG